jgi:hypothetical protein
MIQTPEHDCRDPWLTAMRMMLALVTFDEDAYDRARLELGDCVHCWRAIAEHTLRGMAEDTIYTARSRDLAAAEMASIVGELTGVGHAGEYPVVPDDISELKGD